MGNCSREQLSETTLEVKIFDAIKSGAYRRVLSMIEFCKGTVGIGFLDKLQYQMNKVTTNPLGLCILLGNSRFFQLLYENGCTIGEMERTFEISQFDSMYHICTKGYTDILKLYFPDFLKTKEGRYKESVKSYSISFTRSYRFSREIIPMHIACYNGHIGILSYFYEYFKQ